MTRPPNIVLILADDMGYGDFGVFGDGSPRTPTLDHLVSEGLCFTQHYSASCVCAPARAALLTGRYPHRTGAIDTLEGRGLDRLALSEVTLADVLRAHGYATGLVGKWHLGALDPRFHPSRRGFDEFVGFRGGWQDYYAWNLDNDGDRRASDGRYLTDVLTDEAVAFVRRHRGEPFFLHVTYNAPHFPFQAPEALVAPFQESGRHTRAVSAIYAMIQAMDAGIARIVDALQKEGLDGNTILLFTSDNGPQMGGQGEMDTARHNCGYHGAKGSVYEGGIRVPMVVRWPGTVTGPTHDDSLIHFVDWFPTLLQVAGAPIPPELRLDGHSVLPALLGDGRPPQVPRFWQWNRYTPLVTCNAAVRDGDWKLVRPAIREAMRVSDEDLEMDRSLKYEPERHDDIRRDPEPARDVPPPPPPELYNLADDPAESGNLSEREPRRAAAMLCALETWFEAVDAERRRIPPS